MNVRDATNQEIGQMRSEIGKLKEERTELSDKLGRAKESDDRRRLANEIALLDIEIESLAGRVDQLEREGSDIEARHWREHRAEMDRKYIELVNKHAEKKTALQTARVELEHFRNKVEFRSIREPNPEVDQKFIELKVNLARLEAEYEILDRDMYWSDKWHR